MDTPKYDPLLTPFLGDLPHRLSRGQVERWMEHSAILEFDSGIRPRALAESLALLDLLRLQPSAMTGVALLEVELDGGTEWLLATDLEAARAYLAVVGASEIAPRDLREVLVTQYGGIATLTRFA